MRVDIKAILRDEKLRRRLLQGACEFLHKLECPKEECDCDLREAFFCTGVRIG